MHHQLHSHENYLGDRDSAAFLLMCLWEVFAWVWGVVLVVCVCMSVSGVLFSVGVCVCDLLIFLQAPPTPFTRKLSGRPRLCRLLFIHRHHELHSHENYFRNVTSFPFIHRHHQLHSHENYSTNDDSFHTI